MSHPGPPRFVATSESVELAPRDPDPSATYRWRLIKTPEESNASLGSDPVEHLVPDEAGIYRARLSAPDGEHDLTIRAFSGELASNVSHSSGASAGESGGEAADNSGARRSGDAGSIRESATGEGGGDRPRLTLQPAIEGDEAVVRANRGETQGEGTVEFLVDDRDDIDSERIRTSGDTLRIPVDALTERTRIYAVAVGPDSYSVPDAVVFERPAAGTRTPHSGEEITHHRPYDPPAWSEDAVVYEVYVRKFVDADHGATFDSLIDRLDYIVSLGVDVIWLTPILENDHAAHGYNITDFTAIASDLGSRDDYERFLEAAHDRGLDVLFDFVCNHSARTHPFFQAALEDTESDYRQWYEWRTETEPETYFEWEHIANFNFDHLPVRRHLLDAVDEWAPLVDGFRCDMAWAVPSGFWLEVHDRCKEYDREFLLLDETIPYIPDYQAGLFGMHFDSTTYAALRRVGNGDEAEAVLDAIEGRAEVGFPEHARFLLYAENHDETRYVTDCGRPAARAALGALFTLPGAPLLYAGQEFGHRGRRDSLAWDHADDELRGLVRSLTSVHEEQPALSSAGRLERVPYEVRDGSNSRVVAYGRSTGTDAVVVVLNFGTDRATVTVPAATGTTDFVSGSSVAAAARTPEATVSVESVVVLPASVDTVE